MKAVASLPFFASTIGRKQLIAVTGLGLSLFVMSHMIGNLLIFVGPEAYNRYGHALTSTPLIYVAEAGLIGMFLLHLGLALKLTQENSAARPEGYAVSSNGSKGTSLVTKTMWGHGLLLAIFVVYHLITFKFGAYYEWGVDSNGEPIRDLHRLVVEVFQNPVYVAWYIVCLIGLGLHLSHGVSSSFQTLGIHHPKHTLKVKLFGWVYAIIVAVGFIAQPVYVFLFHKG